MSNALFPNNTYYYSKHRISETKHFEMENNHNYDKRMTTQTQGLPSNSSNDGYGALYILFVINSSGVIQFGLTFILLSVKVVLLKIVTAISSNKIVFVHNC